jgi:hypothetical protein
MAVDIKVSATFEAGLPKPLFNTRLPPNNAYDVGKNGRFLMPVQIEQAGTVPITVVVNWTVKLKK